MPVSSLGGMLLYRLGRGRGDVATLSLLAASIATAVWFGAVAEIREFQLGLGYAIDPVAMRVITVSAFGLVAAASHIRLDGRTATIAFIAGGLTYPTYLLHQNVGYVLTPKLVALGFSPLTAVLSVDAGVLVVAYAVFRWVEPLGKAWMAQAIDAVPGFDWLPGTVSESPIANHAQPPPATDPESHKQQRSRLRSRAERRLDGHQIQPRSDAADCPPLTLPSGSSPLGYRARRVDPRPRLPARQSSARSAPP